MANQFSFCNEKLSRFSSENMTPAPRGKMRCVTRKIIHIITTFFPKSTLGRTKEFSLNAFDGEKKMKTRLRSVAFGGLIRKWCWVNVKDRSRSEGVLLINVFESLVKINSESKSCQSTKIFQIMLKVAMSTLSVLYASCLLPSTPPPTRKLHNCLPKYHCTSLPHQPLLKNVRLALKLYCFWGTVCQSHASKVFQIWKAPHR